MSRHKLCLLALCFALFSTGAYAQRMALSAELGHETTQFGNPDNSSFTYAKRSSEFIQFGPQLMLFGNSDRLGGWNLTLGGDLRFPFDTSDATGNPMEFAGNVMVNQRVGSMAFGAGFEMRDILLPSEPNFIRPNQIMFGMPVMFKYTFGSGHRAYAQAGGTLWMANYSQNVVSAFGQTVALQNGTISMGNCFTQTCGDLKLTGGYVFGHTALKGSYLYRSNHFSITGNPGVDPAIMDFRQNEISGGIVLTY